MRKYIQLVLIIAAITSIFLVIIYERKYSKMKMVLEVLNSFGNREEISKLKHYKTTTKPDIRLQEENSWIHVIDSLYLNSAFYEYDKIKNISSVIILAIILDKSTELSDIKCYLWYENYPIPLLGVAKLEMQTSDYLGFFIRCSSSSDVSKVPYGVTVTYKSTNSSLITISRFIENTNLVFCVEPLPSGFQDCVLLAEYLTFHNNLGTNHFIIYDRGISPKCRKLLEFAKISEYSIDILKWNYPRTILDKKVYQMDCFARSLLIYNANNVVITKLNEFLVPKLNNLTKILENIDDKAQYKISVHQFCTEYPDIVAETLKFPFLTLKYNKRLEKDISSGVLYKKSDLSLWTNMKNEKKENLYSDQMALHRYEKCHFNYANTAHKYIQDMCMMKYKDLFFMSPLFKYIDDKTL